MRLSTYLLLAVGIASPVAAAAQQLRPIELREIQQWLRDGEPAASIGLKLSERCTPRRIQAGSLGPLQQLGATPATLTQVQELPLCPTIGRDDARAAASGARSATGNTGTYEGPADGTSGGRDARATPWVDVGVGIALSSLHAWHTTTLAQSRRPNLITGMGGVGPMASAQLWPLRKRWLAVGLTGSIARTLYAGDGYGRTGFSWYGADAKALLGPGRVRLALGVGGVQRQGDRLRIDGRDTLEARVDFGGVRWGAGLVVVGSGGPSTGLEVALTSERSAPDGGLATGRAGARVRFADGPIFRVAELLPGAPPAGAPITVLSGRPVAVPPVTNGGNWLLGGGVRIGWPRGPRAAR